MNDSDSIENEIIATAALIESLSKGPDAAIAMLNNESPEVIRRKLTILTDYDRISDALNVISNRKAAVEWIDRAILVYILDGQISAASALLEESKQLEAPAVRLRCRVAYAEGCFRYLLKGSHDVEDKSRQDISKYAIETLQPLIESILIKGSTNSAIEELAVTFCILISSLMSDEVFIDKLIPIYLHREVLDVQVIQAILAEGKVLPKIVAERLLTQLPNELLAIQACAIIYLRNSDFTNATSCARKALSVSKSSSDKRASGALLFEIAQEMGESESEKALNELEQLLGKNHNLPMWLNARKMVVQGDWDSAKNLLDKNPGGDDILWLQLRAECYIKENNLEKGLELLLIVAEKWPIAHIMLRAARIARELKQWDKALNVLNSSIRHDKRNHQARELLAHILIENDDYYDARPHLSILWEKSQENWELGVNYVITLIRLAEYNAAKLVSKQLIEKHPEQMDSWICAALSLKLAGNPKEAFGVLIQVKTKFWNSIKFVGNLMDISFAAGEDIIGAEAIRRLHELQILSPNAPKVLQSYSLESFKDHIVVAKERETFVNEQLLQGKIPWIFAERAMGNGSYTGWMIRTQNMRWLYEERLHWARHVMYSTNAFRIVNENEVPILRTITCHEDIREIVIDITSLITCHRLHILERLGSLFHRIHYPAGYYTLSFGELENISRSQALTREGYPEIDEAIDAGLIKIVENDSDVSDFLDINSLIVTLYNRGCITENQSNKASGLLGEKGNAINSANAAQNKAILTAFDLCILHNTGIIKVALKQCSIHIKKLDEQIIKAEMLSATTAKSVKEFYEDLWRMLRNSKSFVASVHWDVNRNAKDSLDVDVNFSMIAADTAKKMRIPLLVDDRVCQALTFGRHSDSKTAPAFGTDSVLKQLWERAIITDDELVSALLQLIQWRYRFLILDPKILVLMCKNYHSNLPGTPLRKLAQYVHQCMRDPGLFGGNEACIPPMSLAIKLFQKWITNIVQFLMLMWLDIEFQQDKLESLTKWAMRELIPSYPRSSGLLTERHFKISARLIISRAISSSFAEKNRERANAAIRCLVSETGISEDEYASIVEEFVIAGERNDEN